RCNSREGVIPHPAAGPPRRGRAHLGSDCEPLQPRHGSMQAAEQPQDQNDDQDQPENAAQPAVSVSIVPVVAASAAQQEDEKNDDENGGHPVLPARNSDWALSAILTRWP